MAVTDLKALFTLPAELLVTSTARTLTLDHTRCYTLQHTGLAADGTTEVTSNITVTCERGAATAATPSVATRTDDISGSVLLKANTAITIGPGLSSMKLDSWGDSAMVNVIPTEVFHSF